MTDVYANALLTCDSAARDPGGKVTLYGIFDKISARKFPAVHGLFAIYWRCRVPGPGRLSVTILRPDESVLVDLEPIKTEEHEAHVVQGTYTLGGLEFPIEGLYIVVLKYNDAEILRSSLTLTKVEK